MTELLPLLDANALQSEARTFAKRFSATPVHELWGVTDGKAVGTYVEVQFNAYLKERYRYTMGNAASGIDFPELGIDLKATSLTQPQSSCPFKSATQKVYGLGYDLLIFVYEKADNAANRVAHLTMRSVVFVPRERTADYQTTFGLRGIMERGGNQDDIVAFLTERNLPLDEIGCEQLAQRVLRETPELGCLTISNALQWRLQYARAIACASAPSPQVPGVVDLLT